MLLLKSEGPSCFLTIPHRQDDLLWQLPHVHCGEGEVKKKCRGGGGGEMNGLAGINRAIANVQQYAKLCQK